MKKTSSPSPLLSNVVTRLLGRGYASFRGSRAQLFVLPLGKNLVSQHRGFTIVELLIVIVVIGILAALTIVVYNGVQNRARVSSLQSNLHQAAKKLEAYRVTNSDTYPPDLATAGLTAPDGTSFGYQGSASSYCLSGTLSGISYRVSNAAPNPIVGTCSGALANGSFCPSGFIVVPGNSTFGTSEFCTMKYEAKITGQSNGSQPYYSSAFVPESRADGTPWVNVSQINAIAESPTVVGCSGCHLMSEAEWMTIAANVLGVASNWSSGTVGSGYIYQGHISNNPGNSLGATTNDSDGLNGITGSIGAAGWNNRRTLTLSNGEVIWDLSGNVQEWTSSTIASGQQPGLSGESGYAIKQYTNASLLWNGLPALARPANVYPGAGAWGSAQGVGQLTSNYGEPTLRGLYRGGAWNGGLVAGVLALYLNGLTDNAFPYLGFRVSR